MIRFKKDDGSEYPDWEEQLLSNLVDHYGGTALESFVSKDGKCKFISIGNYSPDGKYIDNGQRINPIGKAAEKRLNKNDLVMVLNDKTSAGTIIGSTILIDSDNYIYNQRSERMVCNENVFPTFMWYYINSPIIKNKILKMKQGATQIYVNFISVYNMKTKIPCLEEQEKIADFLSSIDDVIQIQEEKIVALEEQKKGVMQKLFNREVRFKADDGSEYPEWNKEKWGSIGQFLKSGNLSKSDLSEEGTPCILYGELYTKYKEIANVIYSKTNTPCEVVSKKGDVIIPKSGETPEDISTATCIPYDGVALGGDLIIFRSDCILGSYLSYLIANKKKWEIAKIAQGKTIVHINEKSLAEIEIEVPCIEEQKKIADCLSAYDEAIQTKKDKLEVWKEIKKGLLQQMFV